MLPYPHTESELPFSLLALFSFIHQDIENLCYASIAVFLILLFVAATFCKQLNIPLDKEI